MGATTVKTGRKAFHTLRDSVTESPGKEWPISNTAETKWSFVGRESPAGKSWQRRMLSQKFFSAEGHVEVPCSDYWNRQPCPHLWKLQMTIQGERERHVFPRRNTDCGPNQFYFILLFILILVLITYIFVPWLSCFNLCLTGKGFCDCPLCLSTYSTIFFLAVLDISKRYAFLLILIPPLLHAPHFTT